MSRKGTLLLPPEKGQAGDSLGPAFGSWQCSGARSQILAVAVSGLAFLLDLVRGNEQRTCATFCQRSRVTTTQAGGLSGAISANLATGPAGVTTYVYDARNGLVDIMVPGAKNDSCEHDEKKRGMNGLQLVLLSNCVPVSLPLGFSRFEVGPTENPVREIVSDRRPRRIPLLAAGMVCHNCQKGALHDVFLSSTRERRSTTSGACRLRQRWLPAG